LLQAAKPDGIVVSPCLLNVGGYNWNSAIHQA